jgi:hypothetical protein
MLQVTRSSITCNGLPRSEHRSAKAEPGLGVQTRKAPGKRL